MSFISRLFQDEAKNHADRIIDFCNSFSPDHFESYKDRTNTMAQLLDKTTDSVIDSLVHKARHSNQQIAAMASMYINVYNTKTKIENLDMTAPEEVQSINQYRKLESAQHIFDFAQTSFMTIEKMRKDGGYISTAQGPVLEEIGNRYMSFAMGMRYLDEGKNFEVMNGIKKELLFAKKDGIDLLSDKRKHEIVSKNVDKLREDITTQTNAQLALESFTQALAIYTQGHAFLQAEKTDKKIPAKDIKAYAQSIERVKEQITFCCDVYGLKSPLVKPEVKKTVTATA